MVCGEGDGETRGPEEESEADCQLSNKLPYQKSLAGPPCGSCRQNSIGLTAQKHGATSRVIRPRWTQRPGTGLRHVTCVSHSSCPLTVDAALKSLAGFRVQSSLGEGFRKGDTLHFGFPLRGTFQQTLPTPLKRRRQQQTPPGWSLVGCHLWGRTEWDTTKAT